MASLACSQSFAWCPSFGEEARRGPGQGVGPRGAGTHLKGILLRLVPATHHPTRIPSRRGDPSRGDWDEVKTDEHRLLAARPWRSLLARGRGENCGRTRTHMQAKHTYGYASTLVCMWRMYDCNYVCVCGNKHALIPVCVCWPAYLRLLVSSDGLYKHQVSVDK